MSKRTWYLIGLVLVAGACNPVLEPNYDAPAPTNDQVAQAAQDTTPGRPQPHRKLQ
jgi:hypothetical protein